MALLNYPVPDLDVTITEASRVLQLVLSAEENILYQSALSEQSEALEDIHQQLKASASCHENWVTDQFKQRLLSCLDSLPTSTAIPVVLPPSKAQGECIQLERASTLLWAVAKLYSEPWLVEGDVATERTQQSEMFAATRLPGKHRDQIKVYPESLHAIVICHGGAFPIQIIQRCGVEGKISPVPLPDLYSQLSRVIQLPPASNVHDPATICDFSALNRHAWYTAREEILKAGGEAAESLGVMESAILALSLEDCSAPLDLAHTLNAVRLGGQNRQCLRYYDKVVNMVVFKDGVSGMLFEHSALDGMVASLVVRHVWKISESLTLQPIDESVPIVSPPSRLQFPIGGVKLLEGPFYPQSEACNPIVTFDVSSYPDVFTIIRGHRGLYDAWINFSLQVSLRQTLGESADRYIMVTPTHMRHFKHGRCDPTYSVTTLSRRLVTALECGARPDRDPSNELFQQFHFAFVEHKKHIKATKNGSGVGPHLAALRNAMTKDNPLKKFLDLFGCPSIYLTGSDLMEGVECAVGNVYANDQLAVTYIGKKDEVRIVLNAKGSFAHILGKLKECLEVNIKTVMLLAVKYAVAGQMGAIECLLGTEKESKSLIAADNNTNGWNEVEDKQSSGSTATRRPDFTLVIHGGAGEEMMLNSKVVEMVEFALRAALTLGASVLSQGGSSLDAVQRSVAALEDCFLFNAGKGSVYNQNGQHELEATIVDGHRKNSGSVACLHNVKNPVNAARHVMDKSKHALLSGEGAQEFLMGLSENEKPVTTDYFHTDIRCKELAMKRSGNSNNHPQTVGAVAVDCWGRLAAATSTGGLVGKLKGRVGDTAIVGAGAYADDKLAVTCSGDGDAFIRQTVAQKVASLYNLKGYTLKEACREVLHEVLDAKCAGIIAVDAEGDAAVETNAGVMFVASMKNGVARAEAFRPMMNIANVIWETDELVAYLHSDPWTPGTTVLTRKSLNGPNSIFHLTVPDYVAMLSAAQTVANLLCERLGVYRCALLSRPRPDKPAHIQILPLYGLEPKWKAYHAKEEEFHMHDPGYCSSKSGPRCDDAFLDKVQALIRAQLPTPGAPPCFLNGDPSHSGLFSRIVRGEEKHWRVWEDSQHVAFLSPFPNTPGFTVLVPRRPLSSDIFSLEKNDYTDLISAVRKVALLLEEGMGASGVALIFEGLEINHAHAKLIPVVRKPGEVAPTVPTTFCTIYPGYVTSADGPPASADALKEIHMKMTKTTPPHTWEKPQSHSVLAIKSQWYRNLFQIQNTLFHTTVDYFSNKCKYSYALTPITTDTISSPMGLGSDSEPVFVNMLGQDVYLADSMQFVLEYFLRFQEGLPGTYYVSPSFRGEEPDSTHLNQFYHVECELLGDMNAAISIAEGYVVHLTRAMLKHHSKMVHSAAGTLSHIQELMKRMEKPLPRVTLEEAIPMMPTSDCIEWVKEGQPQFGRKLTRKGEAVLIEQYGGAVWLTEMDHLSVPFYQAYVEGSCKSKAKAADLLLGLGETVGLGERHANPEMVQEALRHHAVPEESYKWYIDMRKVIPLSSSGWGMGTERYLCWLLQHTDVRDMQIIPRMKTRKYMP